MRPFHWTELASSRKQKMLCRAKILSGIFVLVGNTSTHLAAGASNNASFCKLSCSKRKTILVDLPQFACFYCNVKTTEQLDMSEREVVAHKLDRALISVTALRLASEGKEIAITFREIEEAMTAAWEELHARAPDRGAPAGIQ